MRKVFLCFFLLVCALGIILITGLDNWGQFKEDGQFKEQFNARKCPQLEIFPIAKLEWDQPIKLELVEIKPPPPNAAQVNGLPGPKYYPVRPFLETFTSPSGLASIVDRGNGKTMPIVILVGKTTRVIPLLQSPLNASARSDGGVWAVTDQSSLSHYDSTGSWKQTVKLPDRMIVGVEEDAVWVLSLDQAWFVSVNGNVRGPYPWRGFLDSAGSKQALCQLEGDAIRRVQCLEPDGRKHYVPLSLPQKLTGKLLSFTDNQILTGNLVGDELGYDNTEGVSANMTIDNAGLTPSGDVFVSVRTDDNNRVEVCTNNGLAQGFSIKYEHSPLPFPLKLSVVAVEGERTLVYGFDRAVWYNRSRVESRFTVNDRRYRNDIFPHLWHISSVTAKSNDRTVIISTTGPTGMALIGLRWHP